MAVELVIEFSALLLSNCLISPIDQKNQIEKAEEQERLEKEKEEERLKEAEKNESEQMKQLSETSHAETKEIVGEQPFSWNLVSSWSPPFLVVSP